jgi:nitrate reductase NapE component
MQCEICGSALAEGETTCHDCGAAQTPGSSGTRSVAGRRKPKGRTWLAVVLAIVALTIVGAGGYVIWAQLAAQSGPDGAAIRMMKAYANYDADGILANATHASLTETDEATFAKQAADSKKTNKGLPAVKDIKVVKVTQTSKDATSATVRLSAKWLTDPETRKYTERQEILTVIKEKGKWIVRLFQ